MRRLLLALAAVAFAPAVAGPTQSAESVVPHSKVQPLRVIEPGPNEPVISAVPTIDPDTGQPVKCRNADAQFAGRDGPAPVEPLRPQKLTELPPATGYMAVYRHIGGCNAPLTMVEYRNPRRR